jgi:hypothetical protein
VNSTTKIDKHADIYEAEYSKAEYLQGSRIPSIGK